MVSGLLPVPTEHCPAASERCPPSSCGVSLPAMDLFLLAIARAELESRIKAPSDQKLLPAAELRFPGKNLLDLSPHTSIVDIRSRVRCGKELWIILSRLNRIKTRCILTLEN